MRFVLLFVLFKWVSKHFIIEQETLTNEPARELLLTNQHFDTKLKKHGEIS